jgi:hypothetical protein
MFLVFFKLSYIYIYSEKPVYFILYFVSHSTKVGCNDYYLNHVRIGGWGKGEEQVPLPQRFAHIDQSLPLYDKFICNSIFKMHPFSVYLTQ